MGMTSPFRRSAASETKKKGGKGSYGSWHDRLKVPQNSATPIVVIRGDYLDPNPAEEEKVIDPATGRYQEVRHEYHKRRKHRRRIVLGPKQEEFMDDDCSAGYDAHNPQPCVGCFAEDSGDKSVTTGDAFALTAVHLVMYHSAPVFEQNGQIMMKKDNSGPVLNYHECQGRTCNFCRVQQGQPPILQSAKDSFPPYQPNMIGNVFGRRKYLDVGKGHLSNLQGWDASIGQRCGVCKADLVTDGFECPTCTTMVIDMTQDPRTDAQIIEAVSKPYPCMKCQRPVIVKEIVSCQVCESSNRGMGRQLSMFNDVVCHAMRQGEGTKSQLMLTSYETLEEFEQRLHPNLRAYFQGKTLRQYVEELGQPYDFDQMFKPKSLQDQAKRLKLPLPGGYQQPQQGGYGQPQPGYGAPPQQQQFMQAPQNYGTPYPPQQQPQAGYAPPPGYVPQQPPQQYQQPAQPQYAPPAAPGGYPPPAYQPAQPYAPYPAPNGAPAAGAPFAPPPAPGKANYGQ